MAKRVFTQRISFSDYDASHMYEWLCMYWWGMRRFGGCYSCQQLAKRLEAFIGPSEVRRIKRVVKKNPNRPLRNRINQGVFSGKNKKGHA